MMSTIARVVRAAADAWSEVQVELHGQYSLERMRRFHVFTTSTSWTHILVWYVATPIPCVLANILPDVAPLAKPSAGRDANYVFWIRGTICAIIFIYTTLMQIGLLVPALGMTHRHLLWTSHVVTIGCTTFNYILAGFVPMPIPFQFLPETPVFMLTSTAMFAIFYGRKLKNSDVLRSSAFRAINAISIQISLTFIYPIFMYGFNSIPTAYQTPYMILIPVIKITAKNVMSKLIDYDDMKPEVLVFCIDAFNAIYVSVAMQHATTVSTSLIVMLIDVAQACVSIYDVHQEFQPLKRFMEKLPANHPLQGKNFLDVAIALDRRESRKRLAELRGQHQEHPVGDHTKTPTPKRLISALNTTRVFPVDLNLNTADMQGLGSEPDRELFLLSTRKLLFTIEVVALIEYSEVIMPVFYSLFVAAAYHLPNRAFYYSILSNIDDHSIWPIVTSVLMYAALELLSLVAMDLALRHITGVSALRQVAFVDFFNNSATAIGEPDVTLEGESIRKPLRYGLKPVTMSRVVHASRIEERCSGYSHNSKSNRAELESVLLCQQYAPIS